MNDISSILTEITPHLILRGLILERSTFYRNEELIELGKIRLTGDQNSTWSKSGEVLSCKVQFRVEGKVDKAQVIGIEGAFAVNYAFEGKKIDSFSIAHLDAVAQINAPYNAWPYWREYVSNVTSRMGLPPLQLPLYKINKPIQEKALQGKSEKGNKKRTTVAKK